MAWRAFWVGLGASAVLVVQALLPAPAVQPDPWVAPQGEGLESSKLGPLARPLRTSEPLRSPVISRARTKAGRPGA